MPGAIQSSTPRGNDIEKNVLTDISLISVHRATAPSIRNRFVQWNNRIENLAGFEARGIARVPQTERQVLSWLGYLQMVLLWFSANVTINNLAVGLCGPLLFDLGFLDSALCASFGAALGAVTTAYMSIWGAQSGNRTMVGTEKTLQVQIADDKQVVGRYFMGYYPSKVIALLNIVLLTGWCIIDAIIGGQVLSAVSGGTMPIAVGVIIVTVIVLLIAGFGLKIFHIYERYVDDILFITSHADRHYKIRLVPTADSIVDIGRLRCTKFRYRPRVRRKLRPDCRESSVFLYPVLLRPEFLGCSSIRLLCILPRRHT